MEKEKEREEKAREAIGENEAPWPGAGELASGHPEEADGQPEADPGAQTAADKPPEPSVERAERDGPAGDTLEKDGDELFFEMSEEEQKLAEANERYVRLLADFDNYRKRVKRENVLIRQSAREEIVLDLLPVIDNLERAVAAGKNGGGETDGSVIKGVELTLRMFAGVMERIGVERIRSVGEKFDPNHHEALGQVESDSLEPDTVAEEILPGYSMSGKVIRAAQVNVARPKASQGGEA